MTFTPQHGLALLALLSGLDHRHAGGDEASVQAKAETWAKILNACGADPQWVRAWCERAYGEPRPVPLYVGDIKRAWMNHQRVQAAKDRTDEVVPIPGMPAGVWRQRPPWFDQYRADVDAVRAQGGDVMGVPLPYARVGVDDSRERRCVNHDICVCTHTECRDGFLDVEGTVTDKRGVPSPAVRRCPVCFDAVQMRGELTPKRRRR